MPEVIEKPVAQQVLDAVTPLQASPLQVMQRQAQLPALNISAMLELSVQRGDSIDVLTKLMDLKDRMDKADAKRLYDDAFAKFKAKCSKVIKGTTYTDGPLKGRKYANLFDAVDAATEHLSEFGLSASWKPIELPAEQDKVWVKLACVLRHVGGHTESVEFGGPVDTGPARSPMQARKSTTTMLERITFLMACGLAEADADDDGQGGPVNGPETQLMARLIGEAENTATDAEAAAHWKANNKALLAWPYAYEKYKVAVVAHRKALNSKAGVPA